MEEAGEKKFSLQSYIKRINKQTILEVWSSFIDYMKGVDNLYMKFIFTIIAIALVAIAVKLYVGIQVDTNIRNINDYIEVCGSVDSNVSGSIDTDVSGSVETY